MTDFKITDEAVGAACDGFFKEPGGFIDCKERMHAAIEAALLVMLEPSAFEYRRLGEFDEWFPCHPDLYNRRSALGEKYEFRATAYRLKEPK